MTVLLPLILLAPLAMALLLGLMPQASRRVASGLAGVGMLLGLAAVLALAEPVFAGEVLRWQWDWWPQAGLQLSLRMDGLAWTFALLVTAIGALIVLYAHYYLDASEPLARFFAYLMLFTLAMLGIVLSGNLLLLLVFWELTSITSFLLVGFWRGESAARQGARMALTVTGLGGLCLLAGVLIVGHIVGSFELDVVLASREILQAHAAFPIALILVLLGAFTKSAQFPFHFWLPQAMAAPTPVSAFLHSATMVKAGVFLLARLYPALGGNDWWFFIVSTAGALTLCIGAYVALFQHDLKGLLAYSTISHLGLITLLLGLDTALGVVAAVFHILNHAAFKASLFMAAGIIDHETGTRDMRRINGLWRAMPYTGALAIVASLAMAGVPLLNGFLSKEMFFAEALQIEGHRWMGLLVPVAAVLAGVFSVAYSLRFVHDVFFNGPCRGLPQQPHEPPRFMRVPVEFLVVLCVVVGVAPALVVGPLLHLAATASYGGSLPEYSLAIWHGFNLPLAMSAVALVGGVTLYFGLQRWVNLHRLDPRPIAVNAYRSVLAALLWLARAFSAHLDRGRLQPMLFLWLLSVLLLASSPYWTQADRWPSTPALAAPGLAWVLFVILLVATLALLRDYQDRLRALIWVGVIGLLVSLCFVLLSAPDLALTQLLVEIASVLLLLLALKYLPEHSPRERARWRAGRDALLATLAGVGTAALCYAVLTRDSRSVADFFLAQAVPGAGGSNAVNVIIVDFRALDTLGEITVFAIAALVIHALLMGYRAAAEAQAEQAADRHPLLLQVVAGWLLPVTALFAVYLLFRGHNQPGGGFIGGLLLGLAFLLLYLAHGSTWMQTRFRPDLARLLGWGLLLAGLTGAAAWIWDFPFLTSYYQYWKLPVIEAFPASSATLFDVGVFIVVSAGSLLALVAIGRVQNASTVRPDPSTAQRGERS